MKTSLKISLLSLLTAFAAVLGYVESFIPVAGIPGVKLGLANFAILLALYYYGVRAAAMVNLARILITGFMFGNMVSVVYSVAGAALSLCVMALLFRAKRFHLFSISVAGGVFHNLGQIAVAALVVEDKNIFYYVPVLIVAGMITGLAIGCAASLAIRKIKIDDYSR